MADKTTTLKTKTNDNVYPNVIGDNRDNAIVNSAHIKHTLTADHKINFRLDNNVSNLIFNSLQKPAGLTKTELVGVGTNGQENIEIGDNLTLANGKLSASGGGDSKKIGTIELDTTQTEAYLTNSDTFALTDSQLDVIRNNDIIHIIFINEEEDNSSQTDEYYKQINYINVNDTKYYIYTLYNFYASVRGIRIIIIEDFLSEVGIRIRTIEQVDPISTYVEKIWLSTMENQVTKEKLYEFNHQEYDNGVSRPITWIISTINGDPVIKPYTSDGKYNYSFTEDKTISLFGKHSILVPKDSADANILPLPADASTSTYVLKAVNGTVQWVKES